MRHKFVEFIPEEIKENTLYISIEYDVAKHKCACGCGADIVTTLSPARFQFKYDGETVSLYPSIGNWNHPCKSHYFITNDEVKWAGTISENQIENVIKNDRNSLEKHIKENSKPKNIWDWFKNRLKF